MKKIDRRTFIQHAAIAGSAVMLTPSEFYTMKMNHIGVQLYSVRDAALKDPKGTLEKLAAMGYTELEGYLYENGRFYGWSPGEYKKLLTTLGLSMPSAHTGIALADWDSVNKRLNDATKKKLEDHFESGVRQLICPGINKDHRNPGGIHRLCEVFNYTGELCKKAGVQFGYHNHSDEFAMSNGSSLIDLILQGTDPELVVWEMDIYWVAYAGQDPIAWIKKYPGRIHAFHVKDMAATAKRETIEIGEGTIDFPSIFKYSQLAGLKYYIVELEHYKRTSLEGVDVCLKNLKGMLPA